ncbi:MAG TPA: 16S rRNA (guanine(966)-N(2))-methyltransferase RsmD [Cyanobacteria bacterium UBA11149]|nr:16S rRNA (guanine(966)-N(2))-methyltransferase RsmD [Cyanobacteria bacterium UBA11367]HBE57099.1 16S rRNA (guanine(966)-N(2))-methyltransferase RsmD [Cyanobacteria bacterium UBA11366]HBK62110.1 16S rRNA (guanine(966)-N(2))-methyltransferase RsmD [Cyanobacteria bacterium UBA11166]HBR76636.1 16S rRNA (guanine(966)-N(2))-methyltransferase RsmD [Cyanobacteria bacterium UBA11159]HBS68354.1 16S rRNA (guanine(966)-N(2))-methyltransferase RsmD [Cyanobacteria bacterium UBA11153]HBW92416.1 16S rRNA (
MRIYGNRQLKTLPGQTIRPTPARVREAIFNIWQGAIASCRWLDLCAGTGSMGAEALCRGASLVVGIDKWSKSCSIVQQNWEMVAQPGQEFQVWRGDVVMRLKSLAGEKFDRIYFDPPYASDLYQPVLDAIAVGEILASEGEIAVEHNPHSWQAITIPTLEICRQKVYGNTAVTFYRRALENLDLD